MEVKNSNSNLYSNNVNNIYKKDKKEINDEKNSKKTSSEKNEIYNESIFSEEEENEFVVNLKTHLSKRNSFEIENDEKEKEKELEIDENNLINSTNNLQYILTLEDNYDKEKDFENNKISEIKEKEKLFKNKFNSDNQKNQPKDEFDFLKKFNSSSDINSNNNSNNINDYNNSNIKDNKKYIEENDYSNKESESEGSIKEFSENAENIDNYEKNTNTNTKFSSNDFSNQIKFEKIFNINHDCNHQFRICLVGDSNVGKTSLLNRYCDDQFKVTQTNTIGVDFKVLALKFNDISIKLQIWDTAGQERFRSISVNYFKSAHGFIIVYDLTNRDSFNNLVN
jgi:hypothetical protein